MNSYFTKISCIDETHAKLPVFYPKTEDHLTEIVVTPEDVESIISILDLNKASGPDEISHRMLKPVSKAISFPLADLFNKSLRQESFPEFWKLANVTPIYKKGETNNVSNYRPVSLLSCCGKILERIVFKHLYNFFLRNNLIYKYQSGFLPRHSTTYQLIDIYHHICQTFEQKQHSVMVFCDISKAFDRVWHKGLLYKLKQNGINGKLLNWLKNYLEERSQKVVINSVSSSIRKVSAGVPQGSVLGPLLFLVYVNDIAESLLSITRLYADDSSLYVSARSIDDIEGIINSDLCIISQWAKQWLVNFNPQKTEAMFFSLCDSNRLPVLLFDNIPIDFVENHKHLGVTFESNGRWNEHINNIIKSASKVLGIMRKMKFTLTRRALNQIYLSYMRPIFEYSSEVWDGCSIYLSEAVENIQNEAARIVTGATRSCSLENLYSECGWQSLARRREIKKICFMYKHANALLPEYVSSLIPSQNSERALSLRQASDIPVPFARTETFRRSCIPSSIVHWNNLTNALKNAPSLTSLKSNLKNQNFTKIPLHFFHGRRYLSVIHTRLRNNCSNLNFDLYNNHLKDHPQCNFCNQIEDVEHFFFSCNNYRLQRIALFRSTRAFHPLSSNKLLYGCDSLDYEQNVVIVDAVHKFINDTNRFTLQS